MLALMIAAAQGSALPAPPPMVSVANSPPPIVAVPNPPPMPPSLLRAPVTNRSARAPIIVRLRASAGQQLLIADRLRVGPSSASLSQQRSEAPVGTCPDYRDNSRRTSINLSLHPSFSADESEYRLSFAWTRPAGETCEAAQRSVSVEQVVSLVPGRTVSVQGDGGVRVELTRE